MIRAFLLDLDATLVQTEKMKALCFAVAVQRLLGISQPDQRVIKVYRDIVGASRDVASRHIMVKLGLENMLLPLMTRYQVSEPHHIDKVLSPVVFLFFVL